MPKSKAPKSKSIKRPTAKKAAESKQATETVATTTDQISTTEGGEATDSKKAAPAKPYKITKTTGLTHKQKAALARQLMISAGDLMDVPDKKFNDDDLLGVDPRLKGEQLSAWVSYLPGSYWDNRLPPPARARGRRKI